MKNSAKKNRGFTLIELMIVVALIGILSAVAIMAYSRYVTQSHNAEATGMLANIRLKQEAYRSTFHQYGCQGANLCNWTPDPTKIGEDPQNWPNTNSSWNQLGVRPDSPVFFTYYSISGPPGGSDHGIFSTTPDFATITTNDFWFAARAAGDVDDTGKCQLMEIYPGNAGIVKYAGDCP